MMHNDGVAFAMAALILSMVAVIFVTAILFCCSVKKTMSHVPEEKRQFPNWFIWMTLIPVVNFIFGWMIFPFGIPNGLKNTVGDNADALRDTKTLRTVGWSLQILATINVISGFLFPLLNVQYRDAPTLIVSLGFLFAIIASILWAIYWVKIVRFRKLYFKNS